MSEVFRGSRQEIAHHTGPLVRLEDERFVQRCVRCGEELLSYEDTPREDIVFWECGIWVQMDACNQWALDPKLDFLPDGFPLLACSMSRQDARREAHIH